MESTQPDGGVTGFDSLTDNLMEKMMKRGKYTKSMQYAFGYGMSLHNFMQRYPKLNIRRIKVVFKQVQNK